MPRNMLFRVARQFGEYKAFLSRCNVGLSFPRSAEICRSVARLSLVTGQICAVAHSPKRLAGAIGKEKWNDAYKPSNWWFPLFGNPQVHSLIH